MNISVTVTSYFGTNCYMLENESAAVVIDPGEITPELMLFAKENNEKRQKAILLTHCHFDHIAGINELKKVFNADVFISAADAEGLNNPNINVSRYLTGNSFSLTADKQLNDGDVLTFGKDRITVLMTPGHTKGSACFIMGDVIFSGDTLFKMNIGRYDLPTANAKELLMSLKRIKNLSGDYTVYSGHGDVTTLEFERQNNFYLKD
ncbi:MAG: MBL fold metallo-hydrolase [Ruminococcaceae bacterium]|nr:MBL fold metallo-hydrolase [Oscillospiraceae bacterium]